MANRRSRRPPEKAVGARRRTRCGAPTQVPGLFERRCVSLRGNAAGTRSGSVSGPVDGVRRGTGESMTELIERTDAEPGGEGSEASVPAKRGRARRLMRKPRAMVIFLCLALVAVALTAIGLTTS